MDGVAQRLEGAVLAGSTDGVVAFGRGLLAARRGEELHLVILPASPRGCSNGANGSEVNQQNRGRN